MVEDRIQDLDSATCGMFQIFLRKICSTHTKKAKFRIKQSLQKKTVETLLNELFTFDDQVANEMKMEEYADEIGVKISV